MTEQIVVDSLPTRKLTHTTPSGKTFTFTVTVLTTNCWLLESDQTHMVNQYGSWIAYCKAVRRLRAYLDAKHPMLALPAPTPRTGNDITRRQREMMQVTGESTPSRAFDVLMTQYLGGK